MFVIIFKQQRYMFVCNDLKGQNSLLDIYLNEFCIIKAILMKAFETTQHSKHTKVKLKVSHESH
jgi:hypothetical protein